MAKRKSLTDITIDNDSKSDYPIVPKIPDPVIISSSRSPMTTGVPHSKEKKSCGICSKSPTTYLSEETKHLLLRIKGNCLSQGIRVSENDLISKGLNLLINKEFPELVENKTN